MCTNGPQQLPETSKFYSRCKKCDIEKTVGVGTTPPPLVAGRLNSTACPVSRERYCDYRHKYSNKFGTLKVKTNRSKFSIFELLGLYKIIVCSKSNCAILTLTRIVDEKCLLLFCTEATIYCEIMQSVKNS